MALVTLKDVRKVYHGGVEAVRGVSFEVQDGSFCVLVGPSGCGKSTLLRMVAGLETISGGAVRIGERVVNDIEPSERDIAMVFQNYALYPHMSVYDNMAYGLRNRGTPKPEIDARVREAARILDIEPYLDRRPKALSGGQRQRVALGRAIVREPKSFFMDEPLSNLDAKLRVQMRTEIGKLHNRIGVTTIYVTHDQTEAMTMADRIVVLKDGVVQQVDTPQTMYERPKNVFVAGFIGSPAMNFMRARLEQENGGYAATFGRTRIPLNREVIGEAKDLGAYSGKEVVLGIRPEHIEDATLAEGAAMGGTNAPNTIEVQPQVIESMGSEKYVYFGIPNEQSVRLDSVAHMTAEPDADGTGSADDFDEMLVARVSAESKASRGDRMLLAVDASKIRLFDAETEQAII